MYSALYARDDMYAHYGNGMVLRRAGRVAWARGLGAVNFPCFSLEPAVKHPHLPFLIFFLTQLLISFLIPFPSHLSTPRWTKRRQQEHTLRPS